MDFKKLDSKGPLLSLLLSCFDVRVRAGFTDADCRGAGDGKSLAPSPTATATWGCDQRGGARRRPRPLAPLVHFQLPRCARACPPLRCAASMFGVFAEPHRYIIVREVNWQKSSAVKYDVWIGPLLDFVSDTTIVLTHSICTGEYLAAVEVELTRRIRSRYVWTY